MATRKQMDNLQKTVLDILNNFGSVNEDNLSKVTIDKFDKILSLISCNIKLSGDSINFDTNEYRKDKSSVFNYKMKYTSTGQISQEDVKELNKIFQNHKKLTKILIDN